MAKVKNGEFGIGLKHTKYHVTCALDSFLTIWLVTLPEKFKQWYEHHNSGTKQEVENTTFMDLNQEPMFPSYLQDSDSTKLSPAFGGYHLLPDTWNLPAAFDHYFEQKNLWTTKFIEDELATYKVVIPQEKSPVQEEVVFTNNAEQEESEEEQSISDVDDEEQAAEEIEDDIAGAFKIKQSSDDENADIGIGAPKSRKKSNPVSYTDQQGSSAKKQRKTKPEDFEPEPVTKKDAVDLILKLAPALGFCGVWLDELMLCTTVKKAIERIQQI